MIFDYREGVYDSPIGMLHKSSMTIELLESMLGRKPNTIVVIGSWDGGDEYRYKEAWPECVVNGIEASPTAFSKASNVCKYNIAMHNIVMAGHDGHTSFYGTDNSNGEWASGSVLRHTAQFTKDTGVKERPQVDYPCMRFDTFCAKNRIHDVDFVQIDTEGYVGGILQGFGDERPKVLMIEILKSEWYEGGDEVLPVCTRLSLMGYDTLDNNGTDWLFKRRT
jgi:FkbM family methyltransferase